MVIFDTEIYPNYFLASFLNLETGKIISFEMYDDVTVDIRKLNTIMSKNTTIGFNSAKFDIPILCAVKAGWDNTKVKTLSDNIILNDYTLFTIEREHGLFKPQNWDHIDIIEVAPGKASLKIYGARLHQKKLQDLPITPDTVLTRKQMQEIREYCENDLHITAALYETLKPQIALRKSMSEQYGMDLRSKSDAQIAEAVIVSELKKLTGKEVSRKHKEDREVYHYTNPKIIRFKSPYLTELFEKIIDTDFELNGAGSIALPDWSKKEQVVINGTPYSLGIGGLHSCEKSQFIQADENHLLIDLDVASYYPNIILQQRLNPKGLGLEFQSVYKSIVERRLTAKRNGDKVTAEVLKICVNGSFGKMGSKYSAMYSPELLIQTTITGQMALLMLIERFEDAGIKVVSANTDGVVMYCHKNKEAELQDIAFDWMLDTTFELERSDYKVLASRDVNNYVAVKLDGGTKGKGIYAAPGLSKNPDFNICCEAVINFLSTGRSIKSTVYDCKDIKKFVSVRRVTGGAEWCGEYLGKAVRFYKSIAIDNEINITYLKNGNKVPNSGGVRPLMNLPDEFPTDVDYDFYINRAKEYLAETGWK